MDLRLQALKDASASLAYLVSVDMGVLARQLDARLIDGLKNGVAQKFEYDGIFTGAFVPRISEEAHRKSTAVSLLFRLV